MLRHYILPYHEPCQTRAYFFFCVLFSLIISLNSGKAAAKQKEGYAKYKSRATQIMRDRINIFNYYSERKLAFEMKDLFDEMAMQVEQKLYCMYHLS